MIIQWLCKLNLDFFFSGIENSHSGFAGEFQSNDIPDNYHKISYESDNHELINFQFFCIKSMS